MDVIEQILRFPPDPKKHIPIAIYNFIYSPHFDVTVFNDAALRSVVSTLYRSVKAIRTRFYLPTETQATRFIKEFKTGGLPNGEGRLFYKNVYDWLLTEGLPYNDKKRVSEAFKTLTADIVLTDITEERRTALERLYSAIVIINKINIIHCRYK